MMSRERLAHTAPHVRKPVSSELTFVDLFCGAGGSSTGLIEAGFVLVEAINHDRVAVDSHKANHPGARHRCEDINRLDKRSITPARCLWASVICTELSPAGGRPRKKKSRKALERTRASALDILAATEIHRYEVVLVENVIEFGTDWELFDWWLQGMALLGYRHQIVCAASSHLSGKNNSAAPQDRDRMYVVFTRKDIPVPDLRVEPEATCPQCGPVRGRQVWRNPDGPRIGKWNQRYDYRCPSPTCGLIVQPTTRPIAEVINWDLPAWRVGDGRRDRKKFTPYAPKTRMRIDAALRHFSDDPRISSADRRGQHALMVHIGRDSATRTTADPLTTVATKPHHSLVWPGPTVDDSYLRMISPREMLRAQRFPADYILLGTVEKQYQQAGNAVSVNASHWLGQRVKAVLA